MDHILNNTYTNIPTCISDALKELYINQKKLQEESRGIVSQTKSLLGSYEQDVNSLRNEVNISSMNFKLYCQTTTERIESIKNNLQNEIAINNIKNEDWRSKIEKKIFQDTIGWEEGANKISNAVKQVDSFTSEYRSFKEKINEQKVDASSFKDCLLDNFKRSTDLIKELSKQLKLDEIRKEKDLLKGEIEKIQGREELQKKEINVNSKNMQKNIEDFRVKMEEYCQQLVDYKKNNDNYVSNLYKQIFDVNKDYRQIKVEIDEKRKSIEMNSIEVEVQREFTLNPKKGENRYAQNEKMSSAASSIKNIEQVNSQRQMQQDSALKNLEDQISDLFEEVEGLKRLEGLEDQLVVFKEQMENKQEIFLEQIREDIKQSLQVHIQSIQENYFIPLMNRRNQTLQRSQNFIEEGEQNIDIQITKKQQLKKRSSHIMDEEESKIERKVSTRNGTESTPQQNREDTFSTIKSQPREEEEDEDQEDNEEDQQENDFQENYKNKGLLDGTTKISIEHRNEQIGSKVEKRKKSNSKNSSQNSSKREMIDLSEPYKFKNISPEQSPLKAKYSNMQNKGGVSISSKGGETNKNNVTVTSFKKRQSGENYSQYIQNSQDSQENYQQNLSFYTEEEENLLNQISSNNNKNHLSFSKRKSLQTQQMFNRTTPKMQGGGPNILNKTLPDLSFDHSTSPSKKWPPLDNAGIHQKIYNINPKNMNSTAYTVMSHSKQNKMTVLNLSLDFINPQAQQQLQQTGQFLQSSQLQAASASGGNGNSFIQPTQQGNNPQGLTLVNYNNKASQIRAQKFLIQSNNQNKDIAQSQRPYSQQASHRNSVGGIFNNKSSNKISHRPKTSQENIQIFGQKK